MQRPQGGPSTGQVSPSSSSSPSPSVSVRIEHGDALVLLSQIPDGVIDTVFTDPPYSSGGLHRSARAAGHSSRKYIASADRFQDFAGDRMDQRSYERWSVFWLSSAYRVTEPGGALVMATDWRQIALVSDCVQMAGWTLRGVVPWLKPNARPWFGRYRQSAEFFVWATKGDRDLDPDLPCLPGHVTASPPRGCDRLHPTQKPDEILRELLPITRPGGIVLDPFCGSGAVVRIARDLGYSAIGFEISAHYAAIARAEVSR